MGWGDAVDVTASRSLWGFLWDGMARYLRVSTNERDIYDGLTPGDNSKESLMDEKVRCCREMNMGAHEMFVNLHPYPIPPSWSDHTLSRDTGNGYRGLFVTRGLY